jgi:ABC-type uncharacterized transport system YnjBCD ATPase subunit
MTATPTMRCSERRRAVVAAKIRVGAADLASFPAATLQGSHRAVVKARLAMAAQPACTVQAMLSAENPSLAREL